MTIKYNLLEHPLIRVTLTDGSAARLTLPEIYAALAADRIANFTALRPHQEPAWHAFLVQLAALGCEARARGTAPGDDPKAWAELLRALTPDHSDDAPWSLVAPPDRPALLQAPAPGTDVSSWSAIETPDALDMLVTSKNHDFKAERMARADADDWLFALVSLQAQEGVMGAGKYGVARMNGGFGSRPFVGLAPRNARPGARFTRDIRILIERRTDLAKEAAGRGMLQSGAIGLVWLEPWDGATPILLDRLHPLFVEVCRRVRLVERDGALVALDAGSKAARISASAMKGDLGDPWGPIEQGDSPKLLSISSEGFSYRKMTELLFGLDKRSYALPLLAKPDARERSETMTLRAAAIARGQGKTEGFHTREIDLPPRAWTWLDGGKPEQAERAARLAQRRVQSASDVAGKALRPALIVLLQKGPAEASWSKPSNTPLSAPWLAAFNQRVDDDFFRLLWAGLDETDESAADAVWEGFLRDTARTVFDAAIGAAPRGDERRFLAEARARNLLEGSLRRQLPALHPPREVVDVES